MAILRVREIGTDAAVIDFDERAAKAPYFDVRDEIAELVEFLHDDGDRRVIAPGYRSWLADLADRLESGRLAYDEEYGLVDEEDDL